MSAFLLVGALSNQVQALPALVSDISKRLGNLFIRATPDREREPRELNISDFEGLLRAQAEDVDPNQWVKQKFGKCSYFIRKESDGKILFIPSSLSASKESPFKKPTEIAKGSFNTALRAHVYVLEGDGPIMEQEEIALLRANEKEQDSVLRHRRGWKILSKLHEAGYGANVEKPGDIPAANRAYRITTLFKDGDLYRYRNSDREVRDIFPQMVNGVYNGYCGRIRTLDIKLENAVINAETGEVILIDWTDAHDTSEYEVNIRDRGLPVHTPDYTSPSIENILISRNEGSVSFDLEREQVYQLAVALLCLYDRQIIKNEEYFTPVKSIFKLREKGEPPFYLQFNESALGKVEDLLKDKGWSPNQINCIKRSLAKKPRGRPLIDGFRAAFPLNQGSSQGFKALS